MADRTDLQESSVIVFKGSDSSLPVIIIHAVQTPAVFVSQARTIDITGTMTVHADSTDELSALIPTHLDHIATRYTFATMRIHSGTPIRIKAPQIVAHLSTSDVGMKRRGGKHGIVALYASSKDANKLTSIVEIAKRAIAGTWYQYTVIRRRPPKEENSKLRETNSEEEDQAFQSMNVDDDQEPMRREKQTKPDMIVFLSATRVSEFEVEMGEQTNVDKDSHAVPSALR